MAESSKTAEPAEVRTRSLRRVYDPARKPIQFGRSADPFSMANRRGHIVICRFVLMCSAAFIAIPAQAAGVLDALGIAMCHTLPKDDDRLKCYDRIAAGIKNKAADLGPDSEGVADTAPQWQIKESKSAIDDSPQVFGSLSDKKRSGYLFLRCWERRIDVVVGPQLGYLGRSPRVLLRINSGQSVKNTWTASTDGRTAFAPAGFINMLPDNATLFVRIEGYSDSYDLTFDVADVSAVREKVVTACQPSSQGRRPTAATKAPAGSGSN